jgi:hypothetical protein
VNPLIKSTLVAGLAILIFFGVLVFALAPDARPGLDNPVRLARISWVGSIMLLTLIPYCLWRAYCSGVVILFGRFGLSKIYRKEEPFEYWLWFSLYGLLIPLILWLMTDRLKELHHRLPAHVQDYKIPFCRRNARSSFATNRSDGYRQIASPPVCASLQASLRASCAQPQDNVKPAPPWP